MVECGSYLATGLILFGVFSGAGEGYEAYVSATVFFALGQIALIIMIRIYQVITPFDVYEEIKKGNTAAGLAVGGMLTSLGIILQTTVSGVFSTWSEALADFGLYTAFGIVLLIALRWIVDMVFLPKKKLSDVIQKDQNVAGVAVAQGALIGLTVVISYVL